MVSDGLANKTKHIYLIYTELIVHAILNLAYSKEYILFIRSTCSKHAV